MFRPDLMPIKSKPLLQLCRPDLQRQVVANLTSAYKVNRKVEYGNIGELSFLVPYSIPSKFGKKLKYNKQIDKLKTKYLIKFQHEYDIEYYIIDSITDTMENDAEYKAVKCFSLGYELSSKLIKDYEATSENLSTICNDLIKNTIWSIGYVDALFDTKYRSFDASTTVLDAVQDLAAKFNALIVWDTTKREINFYQEDNYGSYKGRNIRYGQLLESMTVETNMDEFCTRLKVFGADDLSIQTVNPTGTNYIENYSYFMYPFQRDEHKNVISHSDYMTDELCNALLDYYDLVDLKGKEFSSLLESLESQQEALISKQSELEKLKTDLAVIEDKISVCNASGQNVDGQNLDYWINQRNAKNIEISSKQGEIDSVNAQISNIQKSINELKTILSLESNFTSDQIKEWNQFIYEKEWSDSNYTDAKQLYEQAKIEFKKINEPKFVASISIVNLFEIVSEKTNWEMLAIGDIIHVYHEKLGVNLEAKLIEIDYDYESKDISITIANTKEILNDKERFIKDLYNSISTSSSVSSSMPKWNESVVGVNEVQSVLDNVWDATSREIIASNNNTVTMDRKGIRIHDLSDPMKIVIMQHGKIALSNNGGDRWNTAIDATGVYAERLIGQIIAGTNLTITTNNGDFLVNNNGVMIRDLDLQVTRSDGKSKIILSAADGFHIQSKSGNSWIDRLTADTDGNLTITGNFQTGSGNAIFRSDANGIYLGNSNFNSAPFRVTPTGACTVSNINVTGGQFNIGGNFTVNSNGIMSATGANFSGTVSASTINGSTINGGTIAGSFISGGTISVFTDISIGNNIYMGNGSSTYDRMIRFVGSGGYDSYIQFTGSSRSLILYSSMDMRITGGLDTFITGMAIHLNGTTYLSSNTYIGSSLVATKNDIAGFSSSITSLQNQINSLSSALNGKSNIGHTHTVTIPTHNHGNPQNANSGGGTYTCY